MGGRYLKDEEKKFIRSWEVSRKKGKLKYILTTAAFIGTAPLAGTIFGSIVLYNSISAYSLAKYLRTYLLVYFVGFVGGLIKAMYNWKKNEVRYSKLLNINKS